MSFTNRLGSHQELAAALSCKRRQQSRLRMRSMTRVCSLDVGCILPTGLGHVLQLVAHAEMELPCDVNLFSCAVISAIPVHNALSTAANQSHIPRQQICLSTAAVSKVCSNEAAFKHFASCDASRPVWSAIWRRKRHRRKKQEGRGSTDSLFHCDQSNPAEERQPKAVYAM